MRSGFAIAALLAVTVTACGSADPDNKAASVKTSSQPSRPAPAVVLLPDSGNRADAEAEAKKLSKLGLVAVVVQSPASAPKSVRGFEAAVAEVQRTVARLRKRSGVDPERIGLIGEGLGAHVGAVAAGRDPGLISAAALAGIGSGALPSRKLAPERWLGRATDARILFQRDLADSSVDLEEIRRLVLAAPPGTLMQQYDGLGSAAQAARDEWIHGRLTAR